MSSRRRANDVVGKSRKWHVEVWKDGTQIRWQTKIVTLASECRWLDWFGKEVWEKGELGIRRTR